MPQGTLAGAGTDGTNGGKTTKERDATLVVGHQALTLILFAVVVVSAASCIRAHKTPRACWLSSISLMSLLLASRSTLLWPLRCPRSGPKRVQEELESTGTLTRIIVIITRIPSSFPPFVRSNRLVVLCGRRCMKLEIALKTRAAIWYCSGSAIGGFRGGGEGYCSGN